jgi:hypothetical protein
VAPGSSEGLRLIAQRQSAHERGKLTMLMGPRLLESLNDPLAYWARHRLGELRLGFQAICAQPEGNGLRGDSARQIEASALQSPSTLAEGRLVVLERSAQDIELLIPIERLRRPVDVHREMIHRARDVGQLWAIPGRRDESVGSLEDQQDWSARLDVGALRVRAGKVPDYDDLVSRSVLEQEESVCCSQTIASTCNYARPPMLGDDSSSIIRAHGVLGLNVHCPQA